MEILTEKILDRALARAAVEDYRSKAAPVLAKIVDEGIATFERCWATASGREENLGILFPALHVFEMLDGVDVLLREGATGPARVPMRAAFEARLTLEYVAEADSQRRGAGYVVAEVHRRITGLERWDPATEHGKQLLAEFAEDRLARDLKLPEVATLDTQVSGLRSLLAGDHLQEAAEEYERLRAEVKRRPPAHALWGGPRTLQDLARHLGCGVQYEILYRDWSRTAHGVDLRRQLTEAGGRPAVRVFRDPTEIRPLYSLAFSFGLASIRTLLNHFRRQEIDARSHWRWYQREVRPVYLALAMNEPDA